MHNQLSCEATHRERRQFIELISFRAVKRCYKIHMKLIFCFVVVDESEE